MIPCTIRQLEVFVAAAEKGHFGRTAGALGISQPAVTKQIATLERQVGMRLFVRRRGSTPVLSRDGAAFLDQAKRLLAEAQSLSARCAAISGAPSVVRIASGAHLLNDCIKRWLPEFARADDAPMIACNPVESFADGLAQLRSDQTDLLVFTTAQRDAPGFRVDTVRPVRLSLYGSRRFQSFRAASPDVISELPFVLPAPGSEGERRILDALADAGVICSKIALRQQYSDVAMQLVIDGLGVAALFETMAAPHVARGALVRFDLELPTFHRVVCRREATANAEVDRVAASLQSALAA